MREEIASLTKRNASRAALHEDAIVPHSYEYVPLTEMHEYH